MGRGAAAALLSLMLLGLTAGCGKTADGVTVEGHVSYQGKPAPSGALTFFPTAGRPVTATLASDGSYACRLPAGSYVVAVTQSVKLPAGWKEGDAVPPPALVLPAKYASRLKSPLTATVAVDQTAPIDFALE